MTEDVRPSSTYRTLAEQREVLTPAEEKFETAPQAIGLLVPIMARLVGFV